MIKKIIYILMTIILISSLLLFYMPGGCRKTAEAPSPSPSPSPASEAKGEVHLYGIDPITLDPAVSGEMTSHEYILQLFSGLVRFGDNLEPVPDIAEDWEVSDDGRTYTFRLRQDARFHDGRAVNAWDFKYSWERASNPDTRSLTAATYLGDIVGVKEVLAGKATEISGVQVIDDYTLQVTIDSPKAYFLSKMTYPTAFVVDRINVESGGDWWRQPNGTGPFKLKEWEENDSFVLENNELYHGEKAKVRTVDFKLYGGVPMNLYETGKIDTAFVYLYYIDKVADESGPFYRELQVLPELSFSYIGFNATRPPFDDVNVRKAFTHAIDKNKLVSLVYRDMLKLADGILPLGMPGFNENLAGLDFDANKAKELIEVSRYGDVTKLPSIIITDSGRGGLISQGLEAIINEWRQNLGVEVEVRQLEPERFIYNLKEEKDDMFFMGWIADYPHPQNFLDILFHTGAENNYGEYSNPRVDALLEKAAVEQDSDTSLALYQQAEQVLVDDAAVLPLWFGRNYLLVKPYVKGYNLNPMGFVMLNEVSVEK